MDIADDEVITKQTDLTDFKPKTYSQNWHAYDKAKTNEDSMFKALLGELLFLSIEEDKIPKLGRKGYSLRDILFSMVIKGYYNTSLRKTQSILKECQKLHYITKAPHYKTICNFYNDERISKILDNLILITALPVAELEDTGAVDATGFSTCLYNSWSHHKYGTTTKEIGKRNVWRKAHSACFCKTNIFFSVVVTEGKVGDVSMLEQVIGNKTKIFEINNIVADRAYSSKKVLKFLTNLNINPLIPFKKNTSGISRGCVVWSRLFREFRDNKEKFFKKYHQRSNVETTFFMVKQRFGSKLFSNSLLANTNEIKIKFLCHNLCCLIQETFELGIDIDFVDCVKKIGMCNK